MSGGYEAGRVANLGPARKLHDHPRFIDLAADIFGRLTVLRCVGTAPVGRRGRRVVRWECRCACGTLLTVRGDNLRNGLSTSCGCHHPGAQRPRVDLTGQRFGRLAVVAYLPGRRAWNCLCDCGRVKAASTGGLRRGRIRSCGCLPSERFAAQFGASNPNWKGGTSRDYGQPRHIPGYKAWVVAVKQRAGHRCELCGRSDAGLVSHHIESYDKNPALRTDVSNGVCLCRPHHSRFHRLFGLGSNSAAQFWAFVDQVVSA